MSEKGQAATPKQANVPHHQTTLGTIKKEMKLFRAAGGVVLFKIYKPDKDYSNNFLHVTSLGVPEMDRIGWRALAKLAHQREIGDKKRQHKSRDFGTTGGICTTRIGSEEVIAKPRETPGTNESCVVNAMVALSDYMRRADFLWILRGLRPFNCDDDDDPRNKFGNGFHEDCFIPAARIGLTNLQTPCGYHVNRMNSMLIQYQCVPTFS
jgi:hypothetical protein